MKIFNKIRKFFENITPPISKTEKKERERQEMRQAKLQALRKGKAIIMIKE